jgi:hypothetical protein
MRIAANGHIWTLGKDGQLIATWPNQDGTMPVVHLCINAAGNDFILAGDPSKLPSGWKEVVCSLLSSFNC